MKSILVASLLPILLILSLAVRSEASDSASKRMALPTMTSKSADKARAAARDTASKTLKTSKSKIKMPEAHELSDDALNEAPTPLPKGK